MGLFSKKPKEPKVVSVMYYDGLAGFNVNAPCGVILTDDVFRISKGKPDVVVNLDRNKIQNIDIFNYEKDYMLKYHGQAVSTSKSAGEKMFFVVHYLSENEAKHLDFWGTSFEISKIREMQKAIASAASPSEYSL